MFLVNFNVHTEVETSKKLVKYRNNGALLKEYKDHQVQNGQKVDKILTYLTTNPYKLKYNLEYKFKIPDSVAKFKGRRNEKFQR